MNYDFSKLTTAQMDLLTFEGWRVGQKYPGGTPYPQPSQRTVSKLTKRGLVVPRERRIQHVLVSFSIIEYEVPIPVHMAWCAHCATNGAD